MNIADLIDQYEQGAKLRGLAPTQMNALKPVRRGLGRMRPHNVTPKVVGKYVAERRNGQHSKAHGSRPAADGTIRRELGALSAVLNWAHQKRIVKDAPPTIDLPPPSPPREVFLTLAEADRLFAYGAQRALLGSKVGLFTCLALDTWARAASIEELTWGRVDLDAKQIDYRDPERAETSKRRVPVPLSTRLQRVLWDARPADRNPLTWVTGPITQYTWRKFLANALPGRTDITRHDLRRTGISLAVARGVDLMKVAQMAGDHYDTIIKHYARFAPDYLDGVVN